MPGTAVGWEQTARQKSARTYTRYPLRICRLLRIKRKWFARKQRSTSQDTAMGDEFFRLHLELSMDDTSWWASTRDEGYQRWACWLEGWGGDCGWEGKEARTHIHLSPGFQEECPRSGRRGTGRKAGCSHYQRQRRWWEAKDPEKWLLFEDSILLLEGAGSQEGSKRNTWTQRFRERGTAWKLPIKCYLTGI